MASETVTRSVRLRRHQYSSTVHTVTEMTIPEEIVEMLGIEEGQVVEVVGGADGRMEIVVEGSDDNQTNEERTTIL